MLVLENIQTLPAADEGLTAISAHREIILRCCLIGLNPKMLNQTKHQWMQLSCMQERSRIGCSHTRKLLLVSISHLHLVFFYLRIDPPEPFVKVRSSRRVPTSPIISSTTL